MTSETVTSEATYPYGEGERRDPDEQPEVLPSALGVSAPVVGWSGIDFTFDSGDGRGSYLRSFGFELDEGGAAGVATNFSPRTQLSGFAYTFEGTVEAVELDADVQTGLVVVEELIPELDGAHDPVFARVPR